MGGLFTGRFLIGLSMGMEGSIHSMYVCELASRRWKGPMTSSGVLVITIGILLIYILGSFVHWQVRLFFMTCYAFLICAYCLPTLIILFRA